MKMSQCGLNCAWLPSRKSVKSCKINKYLAAKTKTQKPNSRHKNYHYRLCKCHDILLKVFGIQNFGGNL